MEDPILGSSNAALCTLASGSSGNCSVLVYRDGHHRRICLIDAGLSPRRTRNSLGDLGLDIAQVDAVLLTHLDTDHWHPGWTTGWTRHMSRTTQLRIHKSHLPRMENRGTLFAPAKPFQRTFKLPGNLTVHPVQLSHDELGVTAFRFAFSPCGSTLGFATDVGYADVKLIDHMFAVDVLAIESNYCPKLQTASDRPDVLKERIMGGSGHLSNQETAQAVEMIEPGHHVVFLHLSRQCNHPDLVAAAHAGADYAYTISLQNAPTRWVRIHPTAFHGSTAADITIHAQKPHAPVQ